jgi:hypothetical protein
VPPFTSARFLPFFQEAHMLRYFFRAVENLWSWLSTRSDSVRREAIVENYVRAGGQFGEALSYIAMGECVGFDQMMRDWTALESAYAKLGYRTLSIDDFIEYAGYGKSISHLVRVERASGEPPVFHAEIFARRYKEGFRPKIDFKSLHDNGKPQSGRFKLPSTRDAEVHVRPKAEDDEGST